MMIKERNIAVCVVLSIVTCGIYGIYWLYKMVEEADYLTGNPNPQPPIVVILLSIVTCSIYLIIWLYNTGKRFDEMSVREGRGEGNNGILVLLLAIFGLAIVDYVLIQDNLNKHANA